MNNLKPDQIMDSPLMGERHNYPDDKAPTIEQNAKKLGFSKEEVKHLKRIYNLKKNKSLGSCKTMAKGSNK